MSTEEDTDETDADKIDIGTDETETEVEEANGKKTRNTGKTEQRHTKELIRAAP